MYKKLHIILVLIGLTALGSWSYIAFTVGRMVGNGEGWREKTEHVESFALPTESQIDKLIEAYK